MSENFTVVLPRRNFPLSLYKSVTPRYSDVVDRSRFESLKREIQSVQSGYDSGTSPGVYDDDLKGDFSNFPDKLLIALREGHLDKVEVSKAKEILESRYEQAKQDAKTKAQKNKVQKQYEQQLEVVNNLLGLQSDTESDSQQVLQDSPK